MRLGKIDYINLLPFYVFLKRYRASSWFKKYAFSKKDYPSKINEQFKKKRIDSAFISSIAAKNIKKRGAKSLDIGIVAKGEIWSVLVKKETKREIDIESETSNKLATILDIEGKVIIGDKALKLYLEDSSNYIDLAKVWHKRERLPFVFARFCCNKDIEFYKKLTNSFRKKRIKIPYYILKTQERKKGIKAKDIKAYLDRVSYNIDTKCKLSLKRFYSKSYISKWCCI